MRLFDAELLSDGLRRRVLDVGAVDLGDLAQDVVGEQPVIAGEALPLYELLGDPHGACLVVGRRVLTELGYQHRVHVNGQAVDIYRPQVLLGGLRSVPDQTESAGR